MYLWAFRDFGELSRVFSVLIFYGMRQVKVLPHNPIHIEQVQIAGTEADNLHGFGGSKGRIDCSSDGRSDPALRFPAVPTHWRPGCAGRYQRSQLFREIFQKTQWLHAEGLAENDKIVQQPAERCLISQTGA